MTTNDVINPLVDLLLDRAKLQYADGGLEAQLVVRAGGWDLS